RSVTLADIARFPIVGYNARSRTGELLAGAFRDANLRPHYVVSGSDAERLYTRLGWQRCGVIPKYALWPRGGLCDTTVFYRDLSP
ncbi:MAG: GNAT family N-acetyltransferase, partial [Verrucomicrobiota bacterium]